MLDTTKIKQVPLGKEQYYQEDVVKKQIVLHHTAGNSNATNVVADWNSDARGRIATCIVISGKGKNTVDGQIIQAFSSKKWAYHLGVKQDIFRARKLPWINLDKISIGIEICNWGQLEKIGEKFFNYVDREVPAEEVTELEVPFKGYKYFHKYTDAQIASVKELLLYWNETHSIPLEFNYESLFSVNNSALTGIAGLYTHNSYRKDKVDIYPCPRMIKMLESLSQK